MDENQLSAEQAAPEEIIENGETVQQDEATQNESGDPEQQPEDPKTEEPKRDLWYNRRIGELTKARREAERENVALRAMLGKGQQNTTQPDNAPDPYKLAQEIAKTQSLNDAANRTYSEGKKAYGADFDNAVVTLQQVADLSARTDFLEAVTSLPNAHDVYHHLGTNPDDAEHVLSLSPMKMAIELAKISAKVGRPKPSSKAPAPITPVSKSAGPSADLSDDMPTSEWIRRREEQIKKRRE